MKTTFFGIGILFFFFSIHTAVAQSNNAGFVEGLWYSHTPFFKGEEVRVYVALRNNTGSDLIGTVVFTADGASIGEKDIEVLDGRLIETFIDWIPERGTQDVRASLTNTVLDTPGSDPEPVTFDTLLVSDTVFVDSDTDGDGIGNEEDTDDDGDGFSDEEEIANGTDPLTPDAPEEIENEESASNGTLSDTDTITVAGTSTTQGFERFIEEENTLHAPLKAISTFSQNTKNRIDAHRDKRKEDREHTEEQESSEETNESATSTEITEESGESFFSKAFRAIYDGILFALSLFFTYAIVVQITFICVLLYLLYRVCKKFMNRGGSE